tara:strand:+ start:75 stop:1016 length:942 start_codon:yes stop_codon:yes gene_type:complete
MPTSTKEKRNPQADLTRKVLKQMKEHGANWVKPWKGQMANGAHHNCVTGNYYTGGNVFLLWIAAEVHGFNDPRWSTYKGWESTDTPVPKGEKASAYVLTPMPTKLKESNGKPKLDKNGNQKTGLFFKAVALWNAQQVGAEALVAEERDPVETLANVDDFIGNCGADIRTVEGSDRAFYSPIKDHIVLPSITDFLGDTDADKQQGYYGTALHELGHWTGHRTRLNRPEIYERNSENYAKEELCAELCAVFASAALGIEHTPAPDHAQYLASWMKALENDERLFFKAAGKAQKALAYLQAQQPKPEEEDAAEKVA